MSSIKCTVVQGILGCL